MVQVVDQLNNLKLHIYVISYLAHVQRLCRLSCESCSEVVIPETPFGASLPLYGTPYCITYQPVVSSALAMDHTSHLK